MAPAIATRDAVPGDGGYDSSSVLLPGNRKLTDHDYKALLEFRSSLRRFLHWSGSEARRAGLTPTQHQVLLAIRGHGDRRGPTIGDVAEWMMLRHHSAVELVDRVEKAGLARRISEAGDQRLVRVRLTAKGHGKLEQLSRAHIEELSLLQPGQKPFWELLAQVVGDPEPDAGTPEP
jgi:DNA-binding MarR family transcriptional regulator